MSLIYEENLRSIYSWKNLKMVFSAPCLQSGIFCPICCFLLEFVYSVQICYYMSFLFVVCILSKFLVCCFLLQFSVLSTVQFTVFCCKLSNLIFYAGKFILCSAGKCIWCCVLLESVFSALFCCFIFWFSLCIFFIYRWGEMCWKIIQVPGHWWLKRRGMISFDSLLYSASLLLFY